MAAMKFYVAGVAGVFLTLNLSNSLTDHQYFTTADSNRSEEREYLSIVVQFDGQPPRDNLIVLSA